MLMALYIIQIVVCLFLILVVMFQKSEGGTSLVSSNSYNSFFSSKALVRNPLTKFTIIVGIIFFINSIVIGALEIKKSKSDDDLANKVESISLQKNKPNNAKSNNK